MEVLENINITAARIYLVDDDRRSLRLLEAHLRKAGYSELVLLDDPREVAPRCSVSPPDLVLLDLNMPHLSGFEVLAALGQLHPDLPIPVIMLTGEEDRQQIVHALQLGARDYVTKPFLPQELLLRVRNQLTAHLAQRKLREQAAVLEDKVRARTQELSHSRLELVRMLGRASEYRDNETGLHATRISLYTAALSRQMGLDDEQVESISHASLLHDVGKIGIPDDILLSPRRLTPEEMDQVKKHTLIGAEMLDNNDFDILKLARDIALSHHERWDGSGYPHGLVGEEIPAAAQIVAVADVFDALTSVRPYKKAWTIDAAKDYIQEQSGLQFAPAMVEKFMQVLPEWREICARHSEAVVE